MYSDSGKSTEFISEVRQFVEEEIVPNAGKYDMEEACISISEIRMWSFNTI